ncbi:MAG TPA: M67 family metallopeptidase [Armatimonadota bacterium]|jgi:proteasome lid subunit RPN8/RPN11
MSSTTNGPEPLSLTSAQLDRILAHLREEAPLEGCGLLLGREGRVTEVLPMRNAAASTVRYEIDPVEQLAVHKRLRAEGLSLLSIYHSHPVTEAYPSSTDVAHAEWWQEVWFLIASFRHPTPEVRCFRIIDGEVVETGVAMEGE